MTLPPALRTDRLDLRLPMAADATVYARFYAGATGPGSYGGPRDADAARGVLEFDIDHWARRGFGKYVMSRRDTGDVIGGCGIRHLDDWPSHELTWWLLPEARGHGFAAEASRAVLAEGYACLGWPVIETHVRDENAPARALVARLGGQIIRRDTFPDGVVRDVFALPRPAPAMSECR